MLLTLKKDGSFIYRWSHPIHKCVYTENEMLVFKNCYFDESWFSVSLDESTLTLSDPCIIEQMIEQSDDEIIQLRDDNDDFAKKAKMLPVTFVIKARKQ